MRASLEEYTLEEIKAMNRPLGNKNYDVYDLIMNGVCYEFDDVIMKDEKLKDYPREFAELRQLNFFVMSFVSNKKMALTEREINVLSDAISRIDEKAKEHPDFKTYKVYKEAYRKCLGEFLERSAHFKLVDRTKNTVRK